MTAKLISIVFVSVFFLTHPVCAQTNTKIKAVATFSILGDIVRNVGGDRIDLNVLVPAEGDAHTFEPTPRHSVVLARADVIFENGLFYEHWIDDLVESSGSRAMRVVVTKGIDIISLSDHDHHKLEDHDHEVDPHVWHDVKNVMKMTETIRDGLMVVDQLNAEYYQNNAHQYLLELASLEERVREILKTVPEENRKLVTSHDSLGYFARGYGFTIMGAFFSSATTEAQDPSAEQTAQLLDSIKSHGVKVLFTENIKSKKFIESLAGDVSVVVAPELYTDALGSPGSAGDTYIRMMEHNVNTIAKHLQ